MSTFQALKISGFLYDEEYNTATCLIASILWYLPHKLYEDVPELPEELNDQIRKKNKQADLPEFTGYIDYGIFRAVAEGVLDASRAYLKSRGINIFNTVREELREAIDGHYWPLEWNIE